MRRVKKIISISLFLLGAFFTGSEAFAQTGALEVNIQGTIFDRHEPPEPTTAVSEPFDFSSGTGTRVMISSTSDVGFNIAIFTNDPNSTLFNTFQVPGVTLEVDGVEIPGNAFILFGTVQGESVVGDLIIYSGKINTTGGPTDILYTGSFDNPIFLTQDDPAITPVLTAPIHSWDFISDGTVGNGDTLACEEAQGPTPEPGFIALIERGGCPFTDKLLNASKAGAIAGIIFNHEEGGDAFITNMRTPGSDIPGVFIKRSDGLGLLSHADSNVGVPAEVEITVTDILGTVSGSFKTSAEGVLESVSLNMVISDANDHIFAGTVGSQNSTDSTEGNGNGSGGCSIVSGSLPPSVGGFINVLLPFLSILFMPALRRLKTFHKILIP